MEAARLRFYGVGRRRRRESERKAKASARSDERRNERSEGLAGSVLSCRQRERPRETAVEPRAHSKRVSPLPKLSLSLSSAMQPNSGLRVHCRHPHPLFGLRYAQLPSQNMGVSLSVGVGPTSDAGIVFPTLPLL